MRCERQGGQPAAAAQQPPRQATGHRGETTVLRGCADPLGEQSRREHERQ